MSLLNTLEQKLGRFAIPSLIRIIVGFQALVFVLFLLNPHYIDLLTLNRDAVLGGQFWRVFTFVFIPPGMGVFGVLGVVLALMWLWFLGDGLEQSWGAYRLNVFYFIGWLATLITGLVTGYGTSAFLHLSLLFAFATLFPDYIINLFLVIPLKIKWLAWVSFGLLLFTFISAGLAMQLLIVVSFANYLLFFGPQLFKQTQLRVQVAERRREYVEKQKPAEESLYKCEVCGRTEQSNPELDFRVARDGHEYCSEHLPKPPASESAS